MRRLPPVLARIDALPDDPVCFSPFVPFFDPPTGRPSKPMETHLRLMFLKFRYGAGYESPAPRSLIRSRGGGSARSGWMGGAASDHADEADPRCGAAAVDGLNEALLPKAAEAKLLRTTRLRADTTVVAANAS
jgi:IS5 family transposase